MSYIETSARYEKVMEDGKIKKVTERFLVDALSCVEAETRTIKELTPYVSGDLEATSNKKLNIADSFNVVDAEKFFVAKVAFVTIDERSAKEKKTTSQWIIGATDFAGAYHTLSEEVGKCMADIEVLSIAETPIKEFYQHK